ncbi:MAG: NUDIX domain-containing protein [Patescibacteria group bacterium]
MARTPHLLGASYVVLMQDKKVLLQRRFQTGWMDGFYSLPAGHTEPDEPFSETLKREIREEVGITLTEEATHIAHISHRYAAPDYQIVDAFFVCKQWQGEPTICEKDKADELLWCDTTALPENTVPYIKTALQYIQEGTLYSEYSWNKDKPC